MANNAAAPTDLDLLGLTGVLRLTEDELQRLNRTALRELLAPFKFPLKEVRRLTDESTNWTDEDVNGITMHFGAKAIRFASRHQYMLAFDQRSELAAVGAWRCQAAESEINGVPIAEFTGAPVQTLLGRANASPSYLKGKADLYEVQTGSGSRVRVTLGHRFLTPDGWCSLESLRVGALIAACDTHGDASPKERRSDSSNRYSLYPHRRDGLSHPTSVAAKDTASQPLSLLSDDSFHAEPWHVRPSRNNSEGHPSLHHAAAFLPHEHVTVCGRPLDRPRMHGQDQSRTHRLRTSASPPRLKSDVAYWSVEQSATARYDAAEELSIPYSEQCQVLDLLRLHSEDGGRLQELSRLDHHGFPYAQYSSASFWDEIVNIRFIRHGDFYDVSVPGPEHYLSEGLWHHNSAKTVGGIMRATRLSTWYGPGNKGIIGRFASTDLASTTQADCLKFWEEANLLEDFKEKGRLKVPTAILKCVDPMTQEILGGQYGMAMFLHMDNPAHIHGHEVGWGWIDEAHECPQTSRDKLKGRISLKAFERLWSLWETSNPNGHDRLYDYYFNPEKITALKEKNPRAYNGRLGLVPTTPDNRFLSKSYVQGLKDSLSEKNQRVFLYGSFEAFEGQVHEEWDEKIHVFPFRKYFPRGIPAHWNRLLAGDPGGSDDWAFEFAATDPEGNVIFYDEFCQPGTRIAPFAEALIKRGAGKESPFKWQAKVIDYENKLAAGELSEHGVTFTNAIKKNKTDSIFRLDGYLHPNPTHAYPSWHQDKQGQLGSPRMFVADTCPKLIQQVPQMRWWKKKGSDVTENQLDPNVVDHSYHCLHGDTQVVTRRGLIPIRDLVGTSGEILSHEGWRPYFDCWMTRKNAETVKVRFDDGTEVVCTPDHRFLTPDGWVEASDLGGKFVRAVRYNYEQWKSPSSTRTRRNSKAAYTVGTETSATSHPGVENCIAMYGHSLTDQFRQSIISTIETMLRTVMSQKIRNAFWGRIISGSTILKELILSPVSQMRMSGAGSASVTLESGIALRRGSSGTASTARNSWLSARNARWRHSVNGAASSLLLRFQRVQCDAPSIAMRPIGDQHALIGRQGSASHAGKTSVAISIFQPKHALAPADKTWRTCVSVKPHRNSDTYCIAASDPHSFAVQGGIIVHNCSIYLVRMLPKATELLATPSVNFDKLSITTRIMRQLEAEAKEKAQRNKPAYGGRFSGRSRMMRAS